MNEPSLNNLLRVAFAFVCTTTAVACSGGSSLRGDQFTDGTVKYEVHSPGEGWSEINVDNANVAWLHEPTAAALLVNSHCEGVEDANLQVRK